MTTKDQHLKGRQHDLALNDSTDIYRNFILNKNQKCTKAFDHKSSKNSENGNRKCYGIAVLTKLLDVVTEKTTSQKCNISLKKSYKNLSKNYSNTSFNDAKKEEPTNFSSSKSHSSSTLSLHIAAYENFIEAQDSDSFAKKELQKKDSKTITATKKNPKNHSPGLSSFNDQLEFPRQQQENHSSTPEIQQFSASQKLFSPIQESFSQIPGAMLDEVASYLSNSSIALTIIFGSIFICVITNVFLTLYIAFSMRHSSKWPGNGKKLSDAITSGNQISLCAVIGSGGHTGEMSVLLSKLNSDLFLPRHYIVAETDKMGIDKIMAMEKELYSKQKHRSIKAEETFTVTKIPRSREVGQSYFSSIFTTLWAVLHSIIAVWKIKPDVVLCNGPGTCIPVCLSAFFFDLIRLRNTRIIFVESVCRVKTLSLSGKILYALRIADVILVQWEDLVQLYPRADYIGILN